MRAGVRAKVVVPLLLAALAALGAAWFLTHYDRVPVKVRVGASGEARLNAFLAAERFAARMGAGTHALRSLREFDALPADGLLLLPRGRQSLDRQRIARLIAWVHQGGHLLAEAEPFGVADPLLDALRIERRRAEPVARPLPVDLPEERRLDVSFPDRLGLPRERLRSLALGKGRATLASSLDFARNSRIGAHDNAEFLWRLIEQAPARELFVFLRPQRLSLWGFVSSHAAPALMAAAALLLAWLWRLATRFGPVAPDLPPARRRLLDHLRASGRYYWASGLRERLAVAAREAALRRLARAQPEFSAAPPAEQAERLSAMIGIPEEEAHRFLSASGTLRGSEFTRLAHHAQRVHSVLERGGR